MIRFLCGTHIIPQGEIDCNAFWVLALKPRYGIKVHIESESYEEYFETLHKEHNTN